jgi:hypothetical protein
MVISSLLRGGIRGVVWPRTRQKEIAMKAVLSFAVAVLTVSLSGCAHDSTVAVRESSQDSKYDTAYMARVEHASRGRGVDVKWINPPEKKKKTGDKKD